MDRRPWTRATQEWATVAPSTVRGLTVGRANAGHWRASSLETEVRARRSAPRRSLFASVGPWCVAPALSSLVLLLPPVPRSRSAASSRATSIARHRPMAARRAARPPARRRPRPKAGRWHAGPTPTVRSWRAGHVTPARSSPRTCSTDRSATGTPVSTPRPTATRTTCAPFTRRPRRIHRCGGSTPGLPPAAIVAAIRTICCATCGAQRRSTSVLTR
jgi:hypothetical protein